MITYHLCALICPPILVTNSLNVAFAAAPESQVPVWCSRDGISNSFGVFPFHSKYDQGDTVVHTNAKRKRLTWTDCYGSVL